MEQIILLTRMMIIFQKINGIFPNLSKKYDCTSEDIGFVNIYQLYTKEKIWARGLPLNLINKQFELEKDLTTKNCRV